ncbi:MAG TPA: hypothetical protein VOB72_14895 [Candidatus Dormibacteraeota bacterium]|nr:hypothetical protein [Candidatus Dormibacteraeota bacterium]
MPRAAEAWSRSIGDLWTDILHRIELSPAAIVAEIGPGFAAKIAFGLARLRFRGTVILIEPGDSARQRARAQYQKLLPAARIRTVSDAIPEARSLRGARVDVLVGNHVLDDLLLHAALTPVASAQMFARMRPGEACASRFVRCWRDLSRDQQRLGALVQRVADDFHAYVTAVRPRLVLLNQYPSWQHHSHNLDSIHRHSLGVMRALLERLDGDDALGMDTELLQDRSVVWLISRSRSRDQPSADSSRSMIPATSSVAE